MSALSTRLTGSAGKSGSPLASKLLRTVLSIYLLAAFAITCFQLVLEYQEEEQRLRLELDQVAEAFVPVLAPALWNLDSAQVRGTSEGIWVNRAIWRLTVHDDRGSLIAERARSPDGLGSNWDLPSYEFAYDVRYANGGGREEIVGVLTLASNASVVATRATSTFLYTIANAALKTLLLWLIFYYVLVRVVARPLGVLTRAIRRINPDNSSSSRSQEHNLSMLHTNDEVGDVALSVSELERALIEKNTAIAERERHLEATIEELERASAAKSQFLAHMSHELRTPLNGVLGMTELLAATPLTGQQDECLSVLTSSGEQLRAVINNVLDYSKIESGKLELEQVEFDLRRLVHDCLAPAEAAAAAKGVALRQELRGSGISRVIGDPTKLRQVLENLLSNAVKFTAQGAVTLALDVTPAGEGHVRASFEVTDSGIGITSEQQESLFESFRQGDQSTTRQFGGTGLGLAICRQLVELMGGRIGVESEAGRGSSFRFDVVLESSDTEVAPREKCQVEPPGLPQYSDLRVLVVEDNAVNQLVVKRMLERFGIAADFAGNGAEAVERCETSPCAYDLVFMDIEMPVLDGWAATRALREGPAASRVGKIVGLSAHALSVDHGETERCGMDGYLAKPLGMGELEGVLRGLRDSSAPAI